MGMGLPTPDSWPSASINPSSVTRGGLLYGGLAYSATLGQAGGLMRIEKGRVVSAASHLCTNLLVLSFPIVGGNRMFWGG